MMRPLPCLIVLVMLTAAASAQPAPSLDEIRAQIAAADYQGAVQKIDKQLFPSPKNQTPADRFELLMLKGECRLQLKDRIGASSAFKAAAKVAPTATDLANAQANALTVDRSTSGRYTPRYGTNVEPIDILPIDARKRAMLAYQAELASQYKTKIEAALRADQLPPIEQVFTRAAEMYFLESCAAGQAADAEKVVRELGAHAHKLVQAEVTRCAGRIDYLSQLANSSSDNARGWNSGRLGLTSQQRDEVKAMVPFLTKIRERATEYRGIAGRMGGDEPKWDALVAQTVDTLADAESLYNDR